MSRADREAEEEGRGRRVSTFVSVNTRETEEEERGRERYLCISKHIMFDASSGQRLSALVHGALLQEAFVGKDEGFGEAHSVRDVMVMVMVMKGRGGRGRERRGGVRRKEDHQVSLLRYDEIGKESAHGNRGREGDVEHGEEQKHLPAEQCWDLCHDTLAHEHLPAQRDDRLVAG